MNELSIQVYDKQYATVTDPNGVDISESKWDFIFDFLLTNLQSVYFHGEKYNYVDDEFEKNVFDLCAEVIWDVDDPPKQLLFKIKESSFNTSRKQMEKLWDYYEFPALIFSYHQFNQQLLIQMIESNYYPEQIMSSIDGLIMIFPPHKFSDFLLIRSSPDMPNLFDLKNL